MASQTKCTLKDPEMVASADLLNGQGVNDAESGGLD